jgi:hypothetical protein
LQGGHCPPCNLPFSHMTDGELTARRARSSSSRCAGDAVRSSLRPQAFASHPEILQVGRRQSQAAEAATTSSKAGLRRLNQAAQAAFAIRCRGFTRRASDFDGALILQVNHDCAILLMRTTATSRQNSGLIRMFVSPTIAALVGVNYERSRPRDTTFEGTTQCLGRSLAHGTCEERRNVVIAGAGYGLHWSDLDEDISVEALLLGKKSSESAESFARWLERRPSAPPTSPEH